MYTDWAQFEFEMLFWAVQVPYSTTSQTFHSTVAYAINQYG
jgi:hypothetical protein